MIPAWLPSLSIAVLLLGLVCAVVIAADLVRHTQHIWIMNVVWPVTALFGTVWIKLEVDTVEGVVQIRVTPKTRNPLTIKALSISGVTWKWHFLNHAQIRTRFG